jgi:16S rRNA (cytidine1402-2'-O)-methyltransferase
MSKLFIIPTPIGNLEDITLRALRILGEVDFVMAEDTRTSGFLLKHYNISKKLIPFHLYNEHKSVKALTDRIKNGESAALVSDAGTPSISDPGFLIVRECINNDVEVECLPGPVAFVPALVNSGLPSERFIFEGFLPVKKGRKTKLEELAEVDCTMIFYESPFRLVKTLEQFSETFGEERRVCVSRELTKIHEENARGTISELIDHFKQKTVKGEIVIVVDGKR